MSTYQSVQSASSEDTSVVVTKPTSLAVGDLMVAGIWADSDGSGTLSLTTPSGWTLEESVSLASSATRLAIFTKVADSSDVAASNFTFASSGDGTYHMIGHIVRVTSWGLYSDSSNGSSTSSTTATVTGFTPSRASSLLIGFSGVSDTSQQNTSSWALTTNNPTWTERADTTFNDATRDSALAIYTATRTEVTATGDITVTVSGNVSNRVGAAIIAISAQVNGSITPTTKINAYALSPIQSIELDAIVDNPTLNETTLTSWTNPDKPSTTWSNLDK